MDNDLISRDALKEDFKTRLEKAKRWKENALNRGDEEIVIRATATIDFICEVIMTIDNAPTVHHPNSLGFQDGYLTGKERPQGKWITDNWGLFHCNYCMREKQQLFNNFCSYCGADMKGVKDNE